MNFTIYSEIIQYLAKVAQLPFIYFAILFILMTPFIIFINLKVIKIDLTFFSKTPPLEVLDYLSLTRLVDDDERYTFKIALFRMYQDGLICFESKEKDELYFSYNKLIMTPNAIGRNPLEKAILKVMQEKKCDAIDYQVSNNSDIVLIMGQIHQNLKDKKFLRKAKWVFLSRIISLLFAGSFLGFGFYRGIIEFYQQAEKRILYTFAMNDLKVFLNIDSDGFLKIFGYRFQFENNGYLEKLLSFLQNFNGEKNQIFYSLLAICMGILSLVILISSAYMNLSSKGRRYIKMASNQYKKLKKSRISDPKIDLTYYVAIFGVYSLARRFPEYRHLQKKLVSLDHDPSYLPRD